MLTSETAEQGARYWDITNTQTLSGRGAHCAGSLGPLAGWGGGLWMEMWLMFQMRKVCGGSDS